MKCKHRDALFPPFFNLESVELNAIYIYAWACLDGLPESPNPTSQGAKSWRHSMPQLCVRMRNLLAVVIIKAIIRAKIHHKNVQKQSKERGYTAARAPSEALVVDYPNITWCEDGYGFACHWLHKAHKTYLCGNAVASVHHVSEFCHHLPSASKVAESGGSHSDSPQQRCPEENQLTWQNAARSAINFSISKGCASWPDTKLALYKSNKRYFEARIATLWLSSHITEWILLNSVIMFEGFRGEICNYQIHKSQLPADATQATEKKKKPNFVQGISEPSSVENWGIKFACWVAKVWPLTQVLHDTAIHWCRHAAWRECKIIW